MSVEGLKKKTCELPRKSSELPWKVGASASGTGALQ